jgi:lipopolysaccharide biosynthesis glycosyltransferase
MPAQIFIGYDKNIDLPYRVLKFSIEKHASSPVLVRPLDLRELVFNRPIDPLQSTEFTYTRFLVPHLCNFKGTALFLDNDMLCFSDISELFRLDMSEFAIRCVKHDHRPIAGSKLDGKVQTVYPRKNWSSLMLLNCAKLGVWSKENVESKSGAWLHRFEPITDDKIGEISDEWNTLDWMDDRTKLIHYTGGGPWYYEYRNHPYGEIWTKYLREYLVSIGGQSADFNEKGILQVVKR